MEIKNTPLLFFEDLLESGKYKILQNDYMDTYIEKYGSLKYKNGVFDYERGIIIEDEDTDLSFQLYFDSLISTEYYIAKRNLDKCAWAIVSQNISPNEFLKFQITTLDSLLINVGKFYSEHAVLNQAIIKLKNHIINKFKLESNHEHIVNTSFPSFEWDYLEECEADTIEVIRNLFNGLISKSIIDGSEEDFIKGFLGKEVQNGIKWLLKTKDRKYSSKPTLFAFIDYLMEENFIKDIKEKEYNNAIEYVFREHNGSLLKNIRQSKSSSTATIQEDIRIIIDNLNSPTV